MNTKHLLVVLATIISVQCGPKPERHVDMQGIPMIYIDKTNYFVMGNETTQVVNERPLHEVRLNPFYISTFEITFAQYARFLNEAYSADRIRVSSAPPQFIVAAEGPHEGKVLAAWINGFGSELAPSRITFSNNTFGVEDGYKNHPIVGVTWYGAQAFAEHFNFRLPTEAEWECAAKATHRAGFATPGASRVSSHVPLINSENEIGAPTPVGAYPPNDFGIHDMSGNVREWCLDVYDPSFYSLRIKDNPCNCPVPGSTEPRVVRGGAYDSESFFCRTTARQFLPPDDFDSRTGFRVVRSFYPPPGK